MTNVSRIFTNTHPIDKMKEVTRSIKIYNALDSEKKRAGCRLIMLECPSDCYTTRLVISLLANDLGTAVDMAIRLGIGLIELQTASDYIEEKGLHWPE